MTTRANFAEIAALAGDPARVSMLHALMDGRALTATGLAHAPGIAPQTASGHFARLAAVDLLAVEKEGRHRYHRLATPIVARLLESIMHVAAELRRPEPQSLVGPRDAALRQARTCYDHFAGRLGVSLADAMCANGFVELASDGGVVTEEGLQFLRHLGLDTAPLLARRTRRTGRVLCRPCIDWSERRPHIGGLVGAALCAHSLQMGWVKRLSATRAVRVTPEGERVFRERFGAVIT